MVDYRSDATAASSLMDNHTSHSSMWKVSIVVAFTATLSSSPAPPLVAGQEAALPPPASPPMREAATGAI
ncbi:hypothetical protein SESBI_03712 [Sesbania bispinosa]|nr:hypothetical protein SESBI_03712 [Sesbania bispinosa]